MREFQPDPRWPRPLVDCCQAIAEGINAIPQLHDLLIEYGADEKWCHEIMRGIFAELVGMCENARYTKHWAVGVILNDGHRANKQWLEECPLKQILERSTL